jgi:hypothetical protein
MNRFHQAIALGLASGGLLLASALPSAALPGGPCTLASDDVVSAALGVPAQAFESISIPGLVSCGVRIGDDDNDMSMMHITTTPDAPLDSISLGGGAGAQTGPVEVTPADGLGYPAMFLRIPVDGETLLSLRVQVGDTDVYAFNAHDAADAPARLTALAKAVLPH